MRLVHFVLIALLGVVAFQIAHYAPLLPDTVASHFGPGGVPDGWSSKSSFLTLYVIILVITVGPFLGLPFLLRRLPNDLINLPKKDYWLAPERRDETLRTISTNLLWLGNATLMFLSHVMGVTLAANLTPEPHLGGTVLWALGIYLAFVLVWTVTFVRRFYRTE